MKSVQYRREYKFNSENTSMSLLLIVYLFMSLILSIISVALIAKNMSPIKFSYNENHEQINTVIILGTILWAVSFIVYFMKRLKIIKDLGSPIQGDYISSLPSEHKPAVVSYLLQGENTDGSDLTATLLDLVNRGYLLMTDEYNLKDLLDDKKNVLLTLNERMDINNLSEYEGYLLRWFINELGDGKSIGTSSLRERLKQDSESGQKFLQWQKLLEAEYNNNKFTESSTMAKLSFYVIFFGYMFLFMLGGISLLLDVIVFFAIQCAIVKYVFIDTIQIKLTSEGRVLTKKWRGFIEFIKNYTTIEEKDMRALILYEKYLIYAVALNCANKAIKDMNKNYGWELYAVYK